jgi:CRISPR system Cascade subunit CasA
MNDKKRFNLLYDSWIPVKMRNGETKPIRAFEIVQKDIVAIDAPRADFNAALMQFLIGLLQTVYAPENPRAWRSLYTQPPSEDQLKETFKDIEPAFYLDGDGYRFMQDELSTKVGELRPIEEMIFGAPGESGKEKNQDHFIKRNHIAGLCRSCTASALLTANIFAEDGGRGYFQSMRGNGFVSCLVQLDERISERTLWRNLWLNVMETTVKSEIDLEGSFYWLKDLPDKPFVARLEKIESEITDLKRRKRDTKDKTLKGQIDEKVKLLKRESGEVKKELYGDEDMDNLSANKTVFPVNNSLHVYWAWMRRYFLDTSSTINEQCGICHNMDKLTIKFYKTGKGYKYPKEEWQNNHPCSPSAKYHREHYSKENQKYKDKMLAIEMTQNGLPYTYWQDFLTQTEDQSPAKVVNEHLKRKRTEEQLILWSFGYAMDSNSPKGWHESKTPLYLIDGAEKRKVIEVEISRYVQAANKISDIRRGYLSIAMRMAWFGYDYDEEQKKKKNKKPDPFYNRASKAFYNHPIEISKSFWNITERRFYELVNTLHNCIGDNALNDEQKNELRRDWYKHIKSEAETLFNRWAFRSGIKNNPKRIAKAHNQLMENLNSKSLKQEILALP